MGTTPFLQVALHWVVVVRARGGAPRSLCQGHGQSHIANCSDLCLRVDLCFAKRLTFRTPLPRSLTASVPARTMHRCPRGELRSTPKAAKFSDGIASRSARRNGPWKSSSSRRSIGPASRLARSTASCRGTALPPTSSSDQMSLHWRCISNLVIAATPRRRHFDLYRRSNLFGVHLRAHFSETLFFVGRSRSLDRFCDRRSLFLSCSIFVVRRLS